MKHILFLAIAALSICSCGRGTIAISHDAGTTLSVEGSARYILLPIEDRAPSARVQLMAGDSLLLSYYIRLARTTVDYYVPFELKSHPQMTSMHIALDSTAMCWDSVRLANNFEPREDPLREVWHHTPPYGWMNDPNGMFYKDGEWHLYYQYNPYGNRHGNIHWGHSVSTDLVRWTHLPAALAPDSLGTCASGSCVVDHLNSAGFGKDAVLAFYTAWGPPQVQCMAYSTDGGRTFTRYEGNPVLTSASRNFRDPKLFYHKESARWIMILAVGDHMEFYSSANLREWSFESSFGAEYGGHGGVWECPDLVCLPVDDNPARMKWVLICNINPGGPANGSATQYFTGEFDGHTFTCDTPPNIARWMDFGKDNYAGVTWNNAPDRRTVLIGWMSNWYYCGSVPTTAYRSANTTPRDLFLYSEGENIFLGSRPSPEIFAALGEPTAFDAQQVQGYGKPIDITCAEQGYLLNITIEPTSNAPCGVCLQNDAGDKLFVEYNPGTCLLTIDRSVYTHAQFSHDFNTVAEVWYGLHGEPMPEPAAEPHRQIAVPSGDDGVLRLSLWVDRSSVECFEQSGRFVLTTTVFPATPFDKAIPFAEQSCKVSGIEVTPMGK